MAAQAYLTDTRQEVPVCHLTRTTTCDSRSGTWTTNDRNGSQLLVWMCCI